MIPKRFILLNILCITFLVAGKNIYAENFAQDISDTEYIGMANNVLIRMGHEPIKDISTVKILKPKDGNRLEVMAEDYEIGFNKNEKFVLYRDNLLFEEVQKNYRQDNKPQFDESTVKKTAENFIADYTDNKISDFSEPQISFDKKGDTWDVIYPRKHKGYTFYRYTYNQMVIGISNVSGKVRTYVFSFPSPVPSTVDVKITEKEAIKIAKEQMAKSLKVWQEKDRWYKDVSLGELIGVELMIVEPRPHSIDLSEEPPVSYTYTRLAYLVSFESYRNYGDKKNKLMDFIIWIDAENGKPLGIDGPW